MPVTPFPGGLGLLAKGAAPRHVSFVLFAGTQVAIDLESGDFVPKIEPSTVFITGLLGALHLVLVGCAMVGLALLAARRWVR